MKILVFSDSHGCLQYMEQAVIAEQPDHIVHLGDRQRDAEALGEQFPLLPLLSVPGNCDLCPRGPAVVVTELAGVRLLVTHGHVHGVKAGLLRLSCAALEAAAAVALFGHTHSPLCTEYRGVRLFNPGACGGARPSYGVLEISNGSVSCRIEQL